MEHTKEEEAVRDYYTEECREEKSRQELEAIEEEEHPTLKACYRRCPYLVLTEQDVLALDDFWGTSQGGVKITKNNVKQLEDHLQYFLKEPSEVQGAREVTEGPISFQFKRTNSFIVWYGKGKRVKVKGPGRVNSNKVHISDLAMLAILLLTVGLVDKAALKKGALIPYICQVNSKYMLCSLS